MRIHFRGNARCEVGQKIGRAIRRIHRHRTIHQLWNLARLFRREQRAQTNALELRRQLFPGTDSQLLDLARCRLVVWQLDMVTKFHDHPRTVLSSSFLGCHIFLRNLCSRLLRERCLISQTPPERVVPDLSTRSGVRHAALDGTADASAVAERWLSEILVATAVELISRGSLPVWGHYSCQPN